MFCLKISFSETVYDSVTALVMFHLVILSNAPNISCFWLSGGQFLETLMLLIFIQIFSVFSILLWVFNLECLIYVGKVW